MIFPHLKSVLSLTSNTTKAAIAVALLAGAVGTLFILSSDPSDFGPGRGLTSAKSVVPADWTEYRSIDHQFSLWHPPELSVRIYDEGNNSRTLTFEEKGGEQSFQIFITPYTEDSITKERFALDAPAGVFEEPVEVVVGGVARGTVFFGKHALLGDTREVWFIYRGFLFEVTTYRDLDEWLSKIMATWTFL